MLDASSGRASSRRISGQCRSLSGWPSRARSSMPPTTTSRIVSSEWGGVSRDIAMLIRTDEMSPSERDFAEEMLFSSGRPLMMVPPAPDQRGPFANIVVAWDGGARAAGCRRCYAAPRSGNLDRGRKRLGDPDGSEGRASRVPRLRSIFRGIVAACRPPSFRRWAGASGGRSAITCR